MDGDQAAKINALDWTIWKGSPPSLPIRTGEMLVSHIQNLHVVYECDAQNCARCHKARAAVCEACFKMQPELIKERTRRFAQEARSERAHYAFMRAPLVPKSRSRAAPKSSSDEPGDEAPDPSDRPERR